VRGYGLSPIFLQALKKKRAKKNEKDVAQMKKKEKNELVRMLHRRQWCWSAHLASIKKIMIKVWAALVVLGFNPMNCHLYSRYFYFQHLEILTIFYLGSSLC